MKDMIVSCDSCGYADICKISDDKRNDCKMHKEIEHQYWKKTRVIGQYSKADIRKMQGR